MLARKHSGGIEGLPCFVVDDGRRLNGTMKDLKLPYISNGGLGE